MSETTENQFPIELTDLATVLIKHLDVRQGLWEVGMELKVSIGQFAAEEDPTLPGALVRISRVALVRVPKPTPISVDAAKVDRAQLQPLPHG